MIDKQLLGNFDCMLCVGGRGWLMTITATVYMCGGFRSKVASSMQIRDGEREREKNNTNHTNQFIRKFCIQL